MNIQKMDAGKTLMVIMSVMGAFLSIIYILSMFNIVDLATGDMPLWYKVLIPLLVLLVAKLQISAFKKVKR